MPGDASEETALAVEITPIRLQLKRLARRPASRGETVVPAHTLAAEKEKPGGRPGLPFRFSTKEPVAIASDPSHRKLRHSLT
jgi:hypothetical protein